MEKSSAENKKDMATANQLFEDHMFEIRRVTDWAVHKGYSDPKYFAFRYRNHYARNCKQAMIEMRLEKGKLLLQGKEYLKQYEIARRIGLNDEIALYKYFILHSGVSPGSIRKKGLVKVDKEKGE